ncbi:LacI family DNA-binding transcriptional regulator [Bifidobacterium samirii]|uniref:Purine operon repressor n=1 Tax=Bifidobacterium samirii TaxID=2306974 RepID=A0A430FWD9_9BIFI|nr:LacI family DNA-binding transcriptional regulator [Bifidobacterium samirii]RSX58511.1 purine operon repressor [Bifidobacterium samirii]
MVTLDDVAELAGVSRMTVSNALRGKAVVRPETAARVRRAAAKLGYRPNVAAQQLSSGRTHVISVSVSDFDLTLPAKLMAELSDRAKTHGYQVVVQQTRFSADYEMAMLSSASMQICDGAIVCWPKSADARFEEFAERCPLVMLDAFGMEGRVDCVTTPCHDGAAQAVHHLMGHGARRIAVLGADRAQMGGEPGSAGLRLRGVLDALAGYGVHEDEVTTVGSGWNQECGYAAMRALFDERGWRPGMDALATLGFDALFCACDPVAVGALKALTDAGVRVPADVMVVGFDGVESGALTTPGLTSVETPAADMAVSCLDLLLERIAAGATGTTPIAPRSVTVAHRMLERGSAER